MDHTKKELTCNQTRNVRTAFVSYSELNDKDTLFGGEIMSHFDSACGRAVFNFVKRPFLHRDCRFGRLHPARPEK